MEGVSKETQMSIEVSSMFPGFRFSPTDAELISYYLKKKIEGAEKCVEVISEVEICKHEPWDLPGKSVIKSENEWFFFSARGRKYPNGSQSKRATELGYWKATGKERNVKSGSTVIGTKRTLVFHIGRAPKGERTEWIMHEYCMHGKSQMIKEHLHIFTVTHVQDSLVVCRLRRNAEFRGNDNSNRTAQSLRQLAISDGGIDRDKAPECSRKCSSSYDSHSTELFDSASESEQKLSNETPLAESSCQQHEDSDNEDDFYAEILKDDIVKLDETSLFATEEVLPLIAPSLSATEEVLPLIAPNTPNKVQTQAQQSVDLILSQQSVPLQGTANRRIKLKKQTNDHDHAEPSSQDQQPKCVIDLFALKMGNRRLVFVVFIILSLLLLLSLNGDIKRILHSNLYEAFWN